jgi:hypothetical protein
MKDDKLRIELNSKGTTEGIIALLQSTIEGIKNTDTTLKLKLTLQETKERRT